MKKKNHLQPLELTGKELRLIADEKTETDFINTAAERANEWIDELKRLHPYNPTFQKDNDQLKDYAFVGIFDDAIKYFKNRIDDIRNRQYSSFNFSMRDYITNILAFNFHYDYTQYEWDGVSLNRNDESFFECPCYDELPSNYLKRDMVQELQNFILTAGAMAKSINSDTYPTWRKLLVQLYYDFTFFNNGAKQEAVQAFMGEVQTAARLTCADFAFEERKNNLSPSTPIRDKKRAKKPASGGCM